MVPNANFKATATQKVPGQKNYMYLQMRLKSVKHKVSRHTATNLNMQSGPPKNIFKRLREINAFETHIYKKFYKLILLISKNIIWLYKVGLCTTVKPGNSKPVDSKLQELVNFFLFTKISNHSKIT